MLGFDPIEEACSNAYQDPMRRRIRIPFLLMAALLSSGCEDGTPWSEGSDAVEAEAGRDFGVTAAYARRLIFIGPGSRLPTAAVFDFTALSDSVGVRRGVRARLLSGPAWEPLMDAGWESEPMREPWRIVPGGALSIVVGDGGDLAAIAYGGEPDVRLEPGAVLAESSPDRGTQLVLRQATLQIAGEPVRGVLLDSQLGRAVSPASVPRPVTTDTATDPEPGSAPPTPIARAGAEAFLVNNAGYYAVFTTSASGEIGWVSHPGVNEIHRGAALEPVADPDGDAAAMGTGAATVPEMPTHWRIRGNGSALAGELSAAAIDPSPLPDLGELTALGYILVSGWVEDGGVRRDVFGLVRHVR